MSGSDRPVRRPTAAPRAAVGARAGAATARAPRAVPAPRTPPRPTLKVVDPAVARRQRRVRRVTSGLVTLTVLSLFALVGFNVLLAQHQLELERTQQHTSEARTRYEQLRLDVAQLSNPARIVTEAEQRLGMIQPAVITYLTATLPPGTETVSKGAATPPGWSEVKQHLDDRP